MPFKKVNQLPLTEECKHYDYIEDVPWDLQKYLPPQPPLTLPHSLTSPRYWHQAYSLFQYYDDDIRLTDDAWFGVTPEPIAVRIAADLSHISSAAKTTIVDLFAGAGGNTIAFALDSDRWDRVIACEKDPATLACAQHNARVYGVPEGRITWVLGDCFDYLAVAKDGGVTAQGLDEELLIDRATTTIFASPPWGGVSYRDHDMFDLGMMQPYSLDNLSRACAPWEYTLYLPRTSDLRQIAKLAPESKKLEVVQYCMEGASKAMVVYVPEGEEGLTLHGMD